MAYLIILFRIIVPILFGYAYYWSKPGYGKKIVLSSFIFYWLSNIAIILFILFDHQLSRAFSSRQVPLPPFLCGDINIIFTLVVGSAIVTVNLFHFIYAFVYTVIFGILWAIFLREKKDYEYKVVYTNNSLEENQLENVPENIVEVHQEKDSFMNNENEHLGENSPPLQKDGILLTILKEIFKK